MAYLGNTPTTQSFISGTDYFNGTGSATAFTLSRTVGSINDIQVTVNNVVQQPNDAYTLSGTTLTMTSAPSSGTNNVYVRYLSTTTQVITPSQNTVGTAQLGTITNIASGNSSLTLQTGSSPTTAVTIDTSQNVGIGTSSPSEKLEINNGNLAVGNAGSNFTMKVLRTGANASSVVVGAFTNEPDIQWTYTGSGALRFTDSTASAERMRIDSSGNLCFNTTNSLPGVGGTSTGIALNSGNLLAVSRGSDTPVSINRSTNDGNLVDLRQDGTSEGSISVSGSTVSFNGGHLSRWSQLPTGSKDESIVKGTVLTNLDDMCVWEKEGVVADNEQLNKMKVSDVEGDTNVAGVFVNWTMDEQYGVDDMNVAMTGDMIIRIADGVVVQKGDLLMSAGDGTAKPQGDDIVRSKTVAKVTSNHITCTYADGSYCVPCVLMAC